MAIQIKKRDGTIRVVPARDLDAMLPDPEGFTALIGRLIRSGEARLTLKDGPAILTLVDERPDPVADPIPEDDVGVQPGLPAPIGDGLTTRPFSARVLLTCTAPATVWVRAQDEAHAADLIERVVANEIEPPAGFRMSPDAGLGERSNRTVIIQQLARGDLLGGSATLESLRS